MPTIYLDPSVSNQADWDDVISAALEQVTFAVDEWKKTHPHQHPVIGDVAKFEVEVKIKDIAVASQQRQHNEVVLSTSKPGLAFTAGATGGGASTFAAPVTGTPTAAPSSGSLWGPASNSPTVAATPVKKAASKSPGKVPTYIPVQTVSSAAKCFECGGPGTLMFNSIKCHNSNCKGSK